MSTTVKSLAGMFTSFLSKHATDLNATASVLHQVLAALPVNQETRQQINDAIDRVQDSAVNIENSLVRIIDAASGDNTKAPAVKIEAGDIDKAVARVLPGLVADYLRDHPPVAHVDANGAVDMAPEGGADNADALAKPLDGQDASGAAGKPPVGNKSK